ncbi:FAD-dependent oxidoreductase, partial [Streptomyces sp. NPDC051133]|uniref:FAD-dependent oxidoreductase n=1 Tax=Streptomyces sp. NPDC051133 TaxID=3155521 RepID=UPI0034367B89
MEQHRKLRASAVPSRIQRVPAPSAGGRRKNVLVVGGGPAGVAAATAAARAGCRVVLAEATNCLGGQLAVAGFTMLRRDRLRVWMAEACQDLRAGAVEVRLNTTVRVDGIGAYDHVVLATGAAPRAWPGMPPDQMVVVDAWTAIMRPSPLPAAVVIVDLEGEWSAAEAAITLATHGHAVTVVTAATAVAHRLSHPEQLFYEERLLEMGVRVLTSTAVKVVPGRSRPILHNFLTGRNSSLPPYVGAFVIASPRVPRARLWTEIQTSHCVTRVGDAVFPRALH